MMLSTRNKILGSLIVVSILLRVGSALYQGSEIESLPGVADQISYHTLAQRVLDGHGFTFAKGWWPATSAGEPTAHWSYLYVFFLAVVYTIFGTDILIARLIQALVSGILHPWLTWRIGKRLFGEKAGLVGAAIVSIYTYFVFYAGALMTETFFILAVLWMIDLSTDLVANHRRSPFDIKKWMKLGLAFGLAALLRQLVLLLIPFCIVWIIWVSTARSNHLKRRVVLDQLCRRSLVSLIILGALIAPWTLRNYSAFNRFVLLNTNAGFAFFWGNHPIHGTKFIPILDSGYGKLIPEELKTLGEAELERALLERGLKFVLEDPFRYLLLSLSRIPEYFKFWPSSNSSGLSNLARVLSFGIFLPFFLAGVLLSLFRSQNADVKSDRVFILAFAGGYTLIHLLTWTLVRYRLPVDALLAPFAGLAVSQLLSKMQEIPPVARLRTLSSANQRQGTKL